ncbi:MAG: hypothetical protein LBO71_05870 [Prevotellaceae bacterium]|jgi:hypothetical protein|nr:hypothetical protein [Prevotellaceae bacterium]
MTHKETIQRNIGLTFDFVSYLHDNPSELDKLPDNFTLELKEKDLPVEESKQRVGNTFALWRLCFITSCLQPF